jgi:hypothetical protein
MDYYKTYDDSSSSSKSSENLQSQQERRRKTGSYIALLLLLLSTLAFAVHVAVARVSEMSQANVYFVETPSFSYVFLFFLQANSGDSKNAHPLKGSLGKRMKLFARLAPKTNPGRKDASGYRKTKDDGTATIPGQTV